MASMVSLALPCHNSAVYPHCERVLSKLESSALAHSAKLCSKSRFVQNHRLSDSHKHQLVASSSGRGGKVVGRRPTVLAGTAGLILSMSMVVTPDSGTQEELRESSLMLPFKPDGYNYWTWQGHKVHYVVEGDEDAQPIVLVHGFGASAFHWRHNIRALASEGFRVYAPCLLGFGWSSKNDGLDYGPELWGTQVAEFLRDVVGRPAVLVGNSLGADAVLRATAMQPELVRGLVAINGGGEYSRPRPVVAELPSDGSLSSWLRKSVKEPLQELFQRGAVYISFLQAKQPSRITQVLRTVYKDTRKVDDYLVRSIVEPAQQPGAAQAYYKIVSQILQPRLNVRELYAQLTKPMLLLWGEADPWMTPSKADQIMTLYPSAVRIRLDAGHCPHDEVPQEANRALLDWISTLSSNR